MAVMKTNFGNISAITNKRIYRQKEAYITSQNKIYCKRIKNELNTVLDFKHKLKATF